MHLRVLLPTLVEMRDVHPELLRPTLSEQLQEQVQAKALQELMTQMTDQCFTRCAKTASGDRLNSSEQGCMAMCMDRYDNTRKRTASMV